MRVLASLASSLNACNEARERGQRIPFCSAFDAVVGGGGGGGRGDIGW